MSELTSLRNIGKTLETKLKSVGIMNAEELKLLGSEEAYVRLKSRYPETKGMCLVHLYAIEGAISDMGYNELPEDLKQRLKVFNDNLK